MKMYARVKDVMTTRVIAARADASYADLAACGPSGFSGPLRPGTLVPDLAAGTALAAGLRPRS